MRPQPLICVRDVEAKSRWRRWELWLRDPEGYTVVLVSPDGSAGNGL